MGQPLVGYVAEYLSRYGYADVVVNLHHQPESVREALGDGGRFGVRLHYVFEPEILGTSGALDNARELLDGDTFVVVNGKIVTDINLRSALETHRRTGALATLVLQRNTRREHFSIVEARDELITGFGGMPAPVSDNDDDIQRERDAPLMFTGIHIMEPRIFDYIPRGVFSDTVSDVYRPAIARGERIAAHVADGHWYELSTIPRYLEINLALMAAQGLDVLAGDDCDISGGASVGQAILWDGVVVEAGAVVERSILADGVRVPKGERVENAAVVRAALVRGVEPPPKALRGEFRGDNFVVPLSQ
jgi:NDP-sugar pyrophosphorylase family protein